jgi:hypothetical protein
MSAREKRVRKQAREPRRSVIERERDQLLEMTRQLDEHPEGYDGPCLCRLCMSYADE